MVIIQRNNRSLGSCQQKPMVELMVFNSIVIHLRHFSQNWYIHNKQNFYLLKLTEIINNMGIIKVNARTSNEQLIHPSTTNSHSLLESSKTYYTIL